MPRAPLLRWRHINITMSPASSHRTPVMSRLCTAAVQCSIKVRICFSSPAWFSSPSSRRTVPTVPPPARIYPCTPSPPRTTIVLPIFIGSCFLRVAAIPQHTGPDCAPCAGLVEMGWIQRTRNAASSTAPPTKPARCPSRQSSSPPRPPPGLGRLDELECRRQPGGPVTRTFGDLGAVAHGGGGRLDQVGRAQVNPVLGRIVAQLQQHIQIG